MRNLLEQEDIFCSEQRCLFKIIWVIRGDLQPCGESSCYSKRIVRGIDRFIWNLCSGCSPWWCQFIRKLAETVHSEATIRNSLCFRKCIMPPVCICLSPTYVATTCLWLWLFRDRGKFLGRPLFLMDRWKCCAQTTAVNVRLPWSQSLPRLSKSVFGQNSYCFSCLCNLLWHLSSSAKMSSVICGLSSIVCDVLDCSTGKNISDMCHAKCGDLWSSCFVVDTEWL